jgi:hypothetical protein
MTIQTITQGDAPGVLAEDHQCGPVVHGIREEVLRGIELPFVPDVVPGFLGVGVTVIYADPGLGKSMLAQAVEHHLAYGRPFGPFEGADPTRCLVIDMEGDASLVQERSFTMTAFGMLPTDHELPTSSDRWTSPGGIFYLQEAQHGQFGIDGAGVAERFIFLDQILTDAAAHGYPFRYVRIDTMRLFVGSKPEGVNAYDWDVRWVRELNQLAKRHGAAFLLLHHTNKSGQVSGSQGISGSGEATISIKENPDAPKGTRECLLKSEKTRRGAPLEYAIRMNSEGVWQFDPDTMAQQVRNRGLAKKICDLLARGPATLAELGAALFDTAKNAIRSALHRLAGRREARYVHGAWELVDTQPVIARGPRMAICKECGDRMTVLDPADLVHPGCARPAAPEPEPDPDLPEPEEETGPWKGTDALKASIKKMSKFHPVPCIRKALRDQEPWTLITERMDGHFNWTSPDISSLDVNATIAILDRHGAYPGVCNSVPVAANILSHTGPMAGRGKTAGIYQLMLPDWTHTATPHPLGKTAQTADGDGLLWIVTPHLVLLERLARAGLIAAPQIVDSWTGPVTWSLFEAFSVETARERERTAGVDQAAYVEVKQSSSRAVRGLWPKKVNSPHWRPDWHQSVEAEFAARHWSRAHQAQVAGAQLLFVGHTDEVVFVAPEGADDQWAPAPLEIGPGYGRMAHKAAKIDGQPVQSPMTAGQWLASRSRDDR